MFFHISIVKIQIGHGVKGFLRVFQKVQRPALPKQKKGKQLETTSARPSIQTIETGERNLLLENRECLAGKNTQEELNTPMIPV